jgi:hypothetical protein
MSEFLYTLDWSQWRLRLAVDPRLRGGWNGVRRVLHPVFAQATSCTMSRYNAGTDPPSGMGGPNQLIVVGLIHARLAA